MGLKCSSLRRGLITARHMGRSARVNISTALRQRVWNSMDVSTVLRSPPENLLQSSMSQEHHIVVLIYAVIFESFWKIRTPSSDSPQGSVSVYQAPRKLGTKHMVL